MTIFQILRRQHLIGSIDTPHIIMPKAIHAAKCGMQQVLHETLIRDFGHVSQTHSNNGKMIPGPSPAHFLPPLFLDS